MSDLSRPEVMAGIRHPPRILAKCIYCGQEWMTPARLAKVCDACRPAHEAKRKKKWEEKHRGKALRSGDV